MEAESVAELVEVRSPGDGDRDVPDRVLDDEIPPDHPRDQLAERRIGVGIRAPRYGDQRGEFRVTESAEGAGDGRQDEREDDRGSRAGPGRVSRNGGTDGGEYSRSDDRPDAEHDDVKSAQRPFELVLRSLGVFENRVEVFPAEEAVGHGDP